jgi:disulfide bond formation protein DsbB
MPVQRFNLAVSVLALIALAGGLALLLPPVRRAVGPRLATSGPWLALAVALTATVGSLVYSEYYLFRPCLLCWYQRIAMYPLVPILAVGAWRRDPGVAWYGLPPAIVGLGISIYHYLLEAFPGWGGATSCSVDVPCNVRYVNEFGFVSIAFMAGCGFIAVIGLMTTIRTKESR